MAEGADSPLLVAARRAHLLKVLERDGAVRISEVSAELGVAPVTLRRDIVVLEREGRLHRVYGGAVALPAAEVRDPVLGDGAFGVLVPSLDYYWPGVVRGIEDEARSHGLRIVLRGSSYEATDERPVLERLVETENLLGLIVAPSPIGPRPQAVAQWRGASRIPHVLVERDASQSLHGEALESVVSAHALGALLAVKHLVALGHRRVGLVLLQSPPSRRIAAGWRAACAELKLAPDERFERVIPDRLSHTYPSAIKNVGEIVHAALANGITALLVHADPEAVALVQHAQAAGVSIPGDLSIIAYDDEIAGLFSPALTAVRPPRDDVGRAAVDLLVKRITHPNRAIHRTVVSPRLVIRQSTGPVAK